MATTLDIHDIDINATYAMIMGIVKKAGELAMVGFNKTGMGTDSKQAYWDLVTVYDKMIEKFIVDGIHELHPTHKILGEESSTNTLLTNDPTWIIDPIDGTTNYVHKVPIFGISVAFCVNKEILIGIVYNPSQNEKYSARKGEGAYLNEKRIYTSNETQVKGAIYCQEGLVFLPEFGERNGARMVKFSRETSGTRSFGSAALGLAYLARGIIDIYIAEGLKPWDLAAGALIIAEAGGSVLLIDGAQYEPSQGNCIAGATKSLTSQVLEIENSIL